MPGGRSTQHASPRAGSGPVVWYALRPCDRARLDPGLARALLGEVARLAVGRPVPICHRPGRPPHAEGPKLSLSRTDGLAACAVSQVGPVGVDAEAMRPWSELAGLASRIDHRPAGSALELLTQWTRKEALAKALGTGLPDDVRTLRVPHPFIPAGCWLRTGGWAWIGCPAPPGWVVSLVVAAAPGPEARGIARTDSVPGFAGPGACWRIELVGLDGPRHGTVP